MMMLDEACKSHCFRPLTGNGIFNNILDLMKLGVDYFKCFRPLTGNGIFNFSHCGQSILRLLAVSVPSRGTGFLMSVVHV